MPVREVLLLSILLAIPAAGLPCSSDLDCSLNGVCTAGVCVCDPPWRHARSEACSVMQVEDHPDDYVPAYGGPRIDTSYHAQNLTSWGGNIIHGDDGKYHLWVSAMDGGNGLAGWGHISRIDHAVAEDPMSVFVLADISLPKESHNASPLRAPNGSYIIWHIGSGAGGSGFAHHADSPAGPWHPLTGPACNNPAPVFLRNGTALCGCNNGGFKIYKSENVFSGEWEFVTTMEFPESWGGADRQYLKNEDPYLWQDNRGHLHLLAHRYDYRDGYPPNPNQTMPLLVSGHGYSEDGVRWYFNTEQQPYNAQITFSNGTIQRFSTYERPHLVFDPKTGLPTHLVNGVSPYYNGPRGACDGCAARPGSAHSCVVCKTTEGVDYTYTLVTKLKVN